MHNDIKGYFEGSPEITDKATTEEKSHGRIEKRTCQMSHDIEWLDPEKRWRSLEGIGKITATVFDMSTEKTTTAIQYVIVSDKELTASQVLASRRAHWGVESMQWIGSAAQIV
jgi:hypothetical protein